jgi:hypothetical protein
MRQPLILLSVITASFLLFSCHKDPLRQSPSILQTTTKDLATDSTKISLSEASRIAAWFLEDKHRDKTISIRSAETITKDGIPYLHVINAKDNNGFVILSASRNYAPVLGYSDKGYFDLTHLNPGVFLWLGKHATNMNYARHNSSPYLDSVQTLNGLAWSALEFSLTHPAGNSSSSPVAAAVGNLPRSGKIVENVPVGYTPPPPKRVTTGTQTVIINQVGPLCQSQWGQDCGFNALCPGDPNGPCGHDLTGCVPTAMAQIMRFWKVPYSYNGYVYNWNAMGQGASTDVARLMADIGQSTAPKDLGLLPGQFASYGSGSTGADDTYCPPVFNAFGYSSASRTETISDQILTGAKNGVSYASLLMNEITANQRPCMIGGNSDENSFLGIYWPAGSAHEWVCDGYFLSRTYIYFTETVYGPTPNTPPVTYNSYSQSDINYLHLNWGWDGGDNGWFDCSTNYTQADPSQANYQYFQTIIYNIHP